MSLKTIAATIKYKTIAPTISITALNLYMRRVTNMFSRNPNSGEHSRSGGSGEEGIGDGAAMYVLT